MPHGKAQMTPRVVDCTFIPTHLHSSLVRPSYPLYTTSAYPTATDLAQYTSPPSRLRDLLTRSPVYGFRLDKGDDGILNDATRTFDVASTILLSNLHHTTDRTGTMEDLPNHHHHRPYDLPIPSQAILVVSRSKSLTTFDSFQSPNFHYH